MHNWHAIETEAEYRRLEWERAAAAEARAACARRERTTPRWTSPVQLPLSALKRIFDWRRWVWRVWVSRPNAGGAAGHVAIDRADDAGRAKPEAPLTIRVRATRLTVTFEPTDSPSR